jgi:hypothetical protein
VRRTRLSASLQAFVALTLTLLFLPVRAFARVISTSTGLRSIVIVSSGSNIMPEVFFTSNEQFITFFAQLPAKLPGIRPVDTFHVLSALKSSLAWTALLYVADADDLRTAGKDYYASDDEAVVVQPLTLEAGGKS